MSGIVPFADESFNDEDPKASIHEQLEIDWACTWMEAGAVPALAENKAQELLTQVFPFAF